MLELLKKEFEKLAKSISEEELASNPEINNRLQRILRLLRKK